MTKNISGSLSLLTAGTLVLFAANSVICKLALGRGAIDPASFTLIRLISGAAVLLLLLKISGSRQKTVSHVSWLSAGMLFLYAATFSYAYMTLEAGTGALILFGAVQLTMIGSAVVSGERLGFMMCTGALVAFLGLVYLVFPGLASPSASGSCLMIVSGISWGGYSVMGKRVKYPLIVTRNNFIRSLAFAGIILLPMSQIGQISLWGAFLAFISGAVASGIGYALWYVVVIQMKTVQACVVQLLVPVLASLGGVFFLDELITQRLIISTIVILGGICLSLVDRNLVDPAKKIG